jgi:hypothetical protein
VFFVAMIGMCVAALPVAAVRGQAINITAASFTLYLVATAWMAAVRRDGETGRFETIAMIGGAAVAAGTLAYAALAAKDAAPFFYGFGGFAAFAAAMDLKVVLRGGVSGAARTARHLWRMSLAMLVATMAFFLGQAKFIPAAIREANLHFVPVVLVIAAMAYWLVRVRLLKRTGA